MLFKKWGNGCEYKIQSGTRGGQKLSFLAGARLLRWMEIRRKVKCAIHPSSYPTGMFKQLHDKLQLLKKYVTHLFGQPAYLSTYLPQRLSCTIKLTC